MSSIILCYALIYNIYIYTVYCIISIVSKLAGQFWPTGPLFETLSFKTKLKREGEISLKRHNLLSKHYETAFITSIVELKTNLWGCFHTTVNKYA